MIRGLKWTLSVLALLAGSVTAQTQINGAGATFPNPIYSKWFSEYHKLHPDVQINYQPIGSGGGIQQVSVGTVDFGASDVGMTDAQLKAAKTPIQLIPTVMGSVVPAYNIPGVKEDLKFTPDVLANIFLGKITNWNDPAIQKINPDVKLPNQTINVVHRSDGSGTTGVFTDYLSKVSPEWKSTVGSGTSVKWPVGIGGKGNEGVAGTIRSVDGAIGYVELIYALSNKITFGSVKNKAGVFMKANLENTSAAANGVKIPDDYRVSITNSPNKDAYPIATFTWLLIPKKSSDPNKGKVIKDFLAWMIDDGQKMVEQLDYAPLPTELQARVKKTISTLPL
ncbi:MAG TPA: phosphate ABC transporter substrate-binding protein PstS [Terriglobales bacterium]|nr:phosphate ABC transporter substrate-binding protein PstS [Terriglobales bacterium]